MDILDTGKRANTTWMLLHEMLMEVYNTDNTSGSTWSGCIIMCVELTYLRV